ncbi:MAG: TolC family outer membrane protein [Alphaproteobacteria bacterium]|nr:TolC family outer membrane protein [Alphaproteobacteria bacterium]
MSVSKWTAALARANAAAFVMAASVFAFAGALEAHTLTDALINAYRNSPQLKSERAALRGTDENVAQAWAGFRPTLNLSTTTGYTYFFKSGATTRAASAALSAELLLWDGGNNLLALDVARKNVEIAREALVDTEQQVLLNAVIAYMDMRRDEQFLELSENNREVIARQVQATRDRLEVGEVRRTDLSQAEALLAGALSTVALRQGTLEISREAFYVAVGVYPDDLQAPPPLPSIPATLEAAKAIAMQRHPTILRTRRLSEMADLNVHRAEATMKPRISVSGNLALNANTFTGDTASLSLNGSVPLYRGGALTSAVRQSKAIQEKARADVQLAGLLVGQNTTRFWQQLEIARASIVARQKEVRASRVALRGIREEADLGARTTLDVLKAEADLVTAESNIVSAKRDQYVAIYSLLSSMGLLTVNHLKLGIKTYDPNINFNKVATAPGPTDRGKLLEKIFTRAGKK